MSSSGPEWDSAAGVWRGNKAAQMSDEDLPDPLVVFGYGSLCWRPGTELEGFECFPCKLGGWCRLFAQRSTDHRGVPESPGLVATLLEVDSVLKLPNSENSILPTETIGMAYIIPPESRRRVLDDLDFREKGGYTRKVVTVTDLSDDTKQTQALVYSATTDNPNFWWGEDGKQWNAELAAHIITTAHGPSGPNIEYFENLCEFLDSMAVEDSHISDLREAIQSAK